MLRQNIDAYKLLKNLHELMRHDDDSPRFSIIDALALLIINDHPGSSKSDLTELLYGDRQASKSSLDKPIFRLVSYDLIDADYNPSGATKSGNPRTAYKVSKEGEKFLRSCEH